jgi:hypothetical protein
MYVIEGLDSFLDLPVGSFAVLLKIHHAAIDVARGNQITALLHDISPESPPPAPPAPWFPESAPGDLLLRPETQVGQDAAPSPDRLLILTGGRGPIAILRSGGPTHRLDAAPALGAIDSDGRMRLVSGRSADARRPVQIMVGGATMPVSPSADGRWSLGAGPPAGPDTFQVDGVAFNWPGEGPMGEGLVVERAGQGWRVGWSGPAGARQSTWLPDAAAP